MRDFGVPKYHNLHIVQSWYSPLHESFFFKTDTCSMSLILNSSRSDSQQSSLFHFNKEQSLNDTQELKIPFMYGDERRQVMCRDAIEIWKTFYI
jgi:hypothetical protein